MTDKSVRPLDLGGSPLERGIDTRELGIDYEASRRREEENWTQKLADKRGRCIGGHDTNLRCVCGEANIIDHATEWKPTPVSSLEIRFGTDTRTARDRFEQFRIVHAYWCETCGLSYRNSVIEEARGYVPPDRQAEAS